MTSNITRRALLGTGAAALLPPVAIGLAAALPAPSVVAAEPVPLADVTTRLGVAMDEVSSLLEQWDPNFRAIINPQRDYWLQNRMLHVPMRTDALLTAWCEACEECNRLWKRVMQAKPGSHQRGVRHRIWQVAYEKREEALGNMLQAIRHDHRAKATPSAKAARVRS